MPMSQVLITMTEKSFGCLGIVDETGSLIGFTSDGDLRRHMNANFLDARTGDVMTRNPLTLAPDIPAPGALRTLNAARITRVFVVKNDKPVGIVHIHDRLRIGIT